MFCQLFHLPTLNMNPPPKKLRARRETCPECYRKNIRLWHFLYQYDGSCFTKLIAIESHNLMLQNTVFLKIIKKAKLK